MAALFFLSSASSAAELSVDRLGDCNWQVTYRGRVYDLAPLTRESLSRPIENDIRFALERVPEAGDRLGAMTGYLKQARAHTILASVFISGFLVTKLLESRRKNDSDRQNFRVVEAAAGGFFLAATLFSWRASSQAKRELVRAVEEFNARSPHKIEPASAGAQGAK